MQTSFFKCAGSFSVNKLAELVGGRVVPSERGDFIVDGIAPIDGGAAGTITFISNKRYASMLGKTHCSVCISNDEMLDYFPDELIAIAVDDAHLAYAKIAAEFFPEANGFKSFTTNFNVNGNSDAAGAIADKDLIDIRAIVSPDAIIEDGVTIGAGAVIGSGVIIGSGTVIAANACIDRQVSIGRDCYVGPGCAIQCALIGDRVIVHGGAKIGQDGFGFAMTGRGHVRIVQIGRVIIQEDVEIGANTCIDRGSNRDTIIGAGTKIDNLVQIAHNVKIGRNCVIAAQSGIAGSTTLDDFVVLGGQVGVSGHITIGTGAQVGGRSGVISSVEPGAKMAGYPAVTREKWLRGAVLLNKMVMPKKKKY